jgi:hypothetical protein
VLQDSEQTGYQTCCITTTKILHNTNPEAKVRKLSGIKAVGIIATLMVNPAVVIQTEPFAGPRQPTGQKKSNKNFTEKSNITIHEHGFT